MNAEADAAFRRAYQNMLQLWPAPPEPRDVVTPTGRTRVQVWGRADAPPLVLLHGFKVTSTMWGPNAGALGQVRRVYAPDTLGDYGFSEATTKPRSLDDLQAWLDALVTALGLDRVDIGGMSYGGWLAAHYAARNPARVRRLVLIAPGASFGSFSFAFVMRGMPMVLWNRHAFVDAYLRWAAVPPPGDGAYEAYMRALVDVMHAGNRRFGGLGLGLPLPKLLPVEVMRAIAAPTLLLYGEHEKMYPATAAIARAREHVRALESHVIAAASHDLTFAQPTAVNAHVVRFLG